jgi:thiamine-monophosphate kinase
MEGRFLSRQKGVHAAIDVSDGLSNDVGHILEESQVGVRLFAETIPISPALARYCLDRRADPLDWALKGGEDYVLLCTIDPDRADQVQRAFQNRFSMPLHKVGEVTDTGIMEILRANGSTLQMSPSGWDHFKERGNN